ncbi:MAG: hypothetical protein U9P36_04890 [Thermodesulfobacteriota bacterium]|nr:hypothetical protein [Thermodesulfobacteriota bacterium]
MRRTDVGFLLMAQHRKEFVALNAMKDRVVCYVSPDVMQQSRRPEKITVDRMVAFQNRADSYR